MEPVTRKEAIAKGLPKYFTGKPCKHGHLSERYTTKADCVECAVLRNKPKFGTPEYKAYRKAHYQKIKPQHAEKAKLHRAKNAEVTKLAKAKYWASNRGKLLEAKRGYRENNKDKVLEQKAVWYERNKDKVRQKAKEDRPKFRARDNHLSGIKRARKIQATPPWADLDKIKKIYEQAARLKFHVDHVIPLRHPLVCGLHVEANLRIITKKANLKKGNKFTIE